MVHALTRFRETRELTLEQFATQVGTAKGVVWKWENGHAVPRPKFMRKIVEATKGVVTANDWYAQEAAE